MALETILESEECCHVTPLDVDHWPEQEILRIESLLGSEILLELQQIMCGCNYSWNSINRHLQAQLEDGKLELTLVDGDVLFEWNNLCNEKRLWDRRGFLSQHGTEFNEACLINLKILPFQAHLDQGLWVGFEDAKLSFDTDSESEYAIDDDSSWGEGSEDSTGREIGNGYERIYSGSSGEDESGEEEQTDSGYDSEVGGVDLGLGSDEEDEAEEVESEEE